MFSIIVPVYNKDDYILKSINSVLHQAYSKFELIVINDGSTDKSLLNIKKFNDPRIVIINQDNTGVSVARNNGVKHARFDYVAFLDADDWWHPQFLEQMRVLIINYGEAGLYGSRYWIVKNGQPTPAAVGVPEGFSAGYIDYFRVYARSFWVPINCSFVVAKKSAFEEQKGFNPRLKFGEDFDLWVRIALAHKVAYMNRLLAYSNQDADTAHRALGSDRCWKPIEHVTFQLGQFSPYEQENPVLSQLLDGLRVRSLLPYRLNGWYPSEVKDIIGRVNLKRQPPFYRFVYQAPSLVVLAFFWAKRQGSRLKQALLQRYCVNRQRV